MTQFKWNGRLLAIALALLAASGGLTASAQDEAPPVETPAAPTLDQRYAALVAELDAELEAFITAYRAAYDAGEADTFDMPHPLMARYGDFVALAEEGSLDAKVWVIENYDPGSQADLARYLGDVLAHDAELELEPVLLYMHYRVPFTAIEAERAAAILAPLTAYTAREDARFGVEARITQARLLGSDPDNAAYLKRSIAIYEALLADEAAAKYHAQLRGELFVMTKLRIGQVAPDFSGANVDGVELKLSDYRGKITVVEFWGFW